MATPYRFDLARMRQDIAAKGWLARDLARAAQVSDVTVHRFLHGITANPRTAERLARALGYTMRRYFVREPQQVAS